MIYKEHELGWGIEPIIYGYNHNHKYILQKYGEPYNIGANGSDLTIMLLSYNRSSSTSDLLNSINDHMPFFSGEVLIVDNGSTEDEKNTLKQLVPKMKYKARIVELDRNYGVAGGRNRGVQHVNTLWIMSVDNDMYFIANPLDEITKVIDDFGCHFMNLPFLRVDGKTIEVDGGALGFDIRGEEIYAWQGSMFKQGDASRGTTFTSSLGTFLLGAGSLYRKDTFTKCGGYDEEMFVGFEDTDFSLTIFRNGYKIANCGKVCLVHNHQKPSTEADKDAERERHNRMRLKLAGEYFKHKNNIAIWDEQVDDWVDQREKDLQLYESEEQFHTIKNDKPWLPKIALVIDYRNWAFENIARQIIKHLSKYFNFTVICTSDPEFIHLARVLYAVKGFDLVHFFWRPTVNNVCSDWELGYVKESGGDVEKFIEEYYKPLKFSTAVYDHLYLEGQDFNVQTKRFTDICNYYYTSSNKLDGIYNGLFAEGKISKKPTSIIADGVDLSLFKPVNIGRFAEAVNKRPLVVGWTGSSEWDGYSDLKGINTIIIPAVESLKQEGYNIDLKILDRKNGLISHSEMPSFYNNLDLYICASEIEGTPNTILEAMACGIPVISTDVGIVPDAFSEIQKNFIIDRNISDLKTKLHIILDKPEILIILSSENLSTIKQWDWATRVQEFKNYFEACLSLS